ncbi:MAG: hypothetical protein ABFD18_19455 [Syntrophomonas sp.]
MIERLGLNETEIDNVLNRYMCSGDVPITRSGVKHAIIDAIIANNRRIEKQLEDIIGKYGEKNND